MVHPGSRIGSYEILSLIGAGGMGEVYRARDTRLQRDVAIKMLSPALARAPDALARFEREALSVAKLSHPNILAIHEFCRDAHTAYVVTELVDGETLRARLEHGPLPPRRAVAYALQIARGMAAAHACGIVHRDLKPDNAMIARDDQVKILDFGLAKPIELSQSEMTQTGAVATGPGTILGTYAYMAPEQIRGLPVDHRTDMFAFGATLYEMLGGERAFKGDTAADTMTAILTKEPPDLDTERLAIAPGLDRIVRRCLEKSPELRFQSANDLAFALETLSTASGASKAAEAPSRLAASAAWIPWTIAAAAAVAAAALWLGKPKVVDPEPPWQRFTPVTEAGGEETSPAISPDGHTVAYAVRVNGSWDIYAQRVGGRNASPVVNDPARDEGGPAYSPDGSSMAFHESDQDGGIFIAGATGESARRLTDLGFDPAWSPDGKRIAFGSEEITDPASRFSISAIYVVDAAGGAPKRLVDGDAAQPSWSPSGERIVYWSNTGGQRDIYTVAARGGERVPVTEDAAIDWAPVWSPDGRYIYFSSDRGGAMNVWRVGVDQKTGKSDGRFEPITTGVQTSAALVRFSRDGSRFVFRSRIAATNPVAIPFDPATLQAGLPAILDSSNNVRIPSDISPDGTEVAYFSVGERHEDIFVSRIDGSNVRRLTDDAERDRSPMFTNDGKSVVFYSNRDGNWQIWTVRLDGSGLRKIADAPSGALYPIPSPDGASVLFSAVDAAEGTFSAPLAGGPATRVAMSPLAGVGANLFPTAWSPDGTKLAGPALSDAGHRNGVAIADLRANATSLVSPDQTYGVRWLPDSRHVIYFAGEKGTSLVVVDTATRQRTVVPVRLPAPATTDPIAMSRDGRILLYGADRAEADIWIAERK